jgi:predicted phage terminase large subunit-like protein
LIKRNSKDVFITRGSTFENEDNLAESALNQYREMYEGTRLGRQELYAEVLEDVEGALWNHRMFESQRIKKEELPEFKRIVIAVDPAVTHGESSDETGIIVVGKGIDERFYVLEDASMKASPDKWMRTAIDLFYTYKADRIVAEVNNGGDLVEKLLRTIDRNIAYKKVQASRGKLVRAEPVVALYEQQKVSHVGSLSSLEDQLCTYAGGNNSPDRLDALVWGISELMTGSGNVFWRVN